jgi:hypothetical protein
MATAADAIASSAIAVDLSWRSIPINRFPVGRSGACLLPPAAGSTRRPIDTGSGVRRGVMIPSSARSEAGAALASVMQNTR